MTGLPVAERSSRRRLSVDERRAELLRIGMRLFSTRAYEEIWVEEIAELAGISVGDAIKVVSVTPEISLTVAAEVVDIDEAMASVTGTRLVVVVRVPPFRLASNT